MTTKFKPTLGQIIFSLVAILLFAGVLFAVRFVTMTLQTFNLPGVAVSMATPTPESQAAEVAPTPEPQAPAAALPPAWDGSSRVTILLLGIDYADWSADHTGPSRSDTMILFTIDPQTRTAGMLSIPRDLWVNIPGFDHARINTAYYQGEANKLPGGGPVLAMKTVEQVIGVPVQYYAQVDFMTFVHLIDQIGGIDVNVEKKVKIDPIGPGADDYVLPAGLKHLDGMKALAYARARNTSGGDVDRAKRQQSVIIAVRNKVMDPTLFPTLIAKAPAVYAEVQNGIKTNMTFEDAIKLAVLLQQIPIENIKQGVIDYKMVLLTTVTVNGQAQDVFKPIPDKIRELRDDIFLSSGATSPMAVKNANLQDINALLELAKQENASIGIYNGTYTQGLALETADYFKALGLNVVGTANASEYPGVTKIIDHRGRPYALRFFQALFGIGSGAQIVSKFDPAAPADIEIILGDEWAAKNPMP
jgi:LCP family protein required for cell wall assembly